MQTINFDINQLLKKTRAGHFLIPQFQRDFVWKEGQTRLLIDSIARNYPIGSLLILGKNESVHLKSRKLDAILLDNEENTSQAICFEEPGTEFYYVLDGQQRLTSVVRVFLDAHPKRNYYFDLKKMYDLFGSESYAWIVSRARGKGNPERKDNNRLIRTDIALDQAKCDVYISEYIEDSGDFPEFSNDKKKARQVAANLKGVFETIRKFSIPFVSLDSDAKLESVCRVFETINSTGTRLTTFDLAVAKYYPDPDLKTLMDGSLDDYPILKEYEIDGERILQTLSLYSLMKNKKFPEATRSVLLSLDNQLINKKWHTAALHFAKICEWISTLGATPKTQPPQSILVSIAATSMYFPDSLNNQKFLPILRKWYFCSTLAANPSLPNNYKIGDDFRKLCDHIERDKAIHYPRVYFTADEIINIKSPSDGRYKAIQSLMRNTTKNDLLTGNPLNDQTEDHHIFPYSLKKSGIPINKINSIANKLILSKESNRYISDNYPEKYFFDLIENYKKEGALELLDSRFKSCFIPYSSADANINEKLSKNRFDQFLKDRAELIIEMIKQTVGDAWQPAIDQEDTNLEEDH